MTAIEMQKQPGGPWQASEASSGPGGTPTLAEVLAEGGDPGGNPITGAVVITPTGGADPLTVNLGADGDGAAFKVRNEGLQNLLSVSGFTGDGTIIKNGVGGAVIQVTPEGTLGFFAATPAARPVIPASPDAQDIADVLVSLGLATQAA